MSRPTLCLLVTLLATQCTSDSNNSNTGPKASTEAPHSAKEPPAEPPHRTSPSPHHGADHGKSTSSNFRKLQPISAYKLPRPARRGMTAEQIKEHATSVGDPAKGEFSLNDAFAGDESLLDTSNGPLKALFETTAGDFTCRLFENKVPNTVANFVGLARGTRPWVDPETGEWVTDRSFYADVLFHRVIKNFMIQTGDRTGTGQGHPGYVIADEFDPSLRHKGRGILSMANRGPNTGSSQFFITVADTPHLNNKHAVFGQCDDEIPVKISQVSTHPHGNRPKQDIAIERITIFRGKAPPEPTTDDATPSNEPTAPQDESASASPNDDAPGDAKAQPASGSEAKEQSAQPASDSESKESAQPADGPNVIKPKPPVLKPESEIPE